MNSVRQTFAANTLWWVPFEHEIHHPVPAYRPSHNRALYHPLTWPDLDDGLRVTTTHTHHGLVLVVDQYLGTLPVVGHDEWMARAIAEDWNRQVKAREINPDDVETVTAWALEIANRTPRARLITEVPWPSNLPTTPYHQL